MTNIPGFTIRQATEADVSVILQFIRGLADYERLAHEVVADEATLRRTLFGERRVAEVLIGYDHEKPVCFALFFHNFSTFLGRPGIYLEDLFVNPDQRGKGFGKAMLAHLAKLAVERECGRLEWSVLDWNEPAINFYKSLGAKPMDEWTIFRVTGDALTQLAGQV
ncbi:MAG TPA: GNAT family N-acetyltransferase [Blastocatellia bacterium]|nr:GNAT family N-acetyltransferase [Blastocatellia bacterium]